MNDIKNWLGVKKHRRIMFVLVIVTTFVITFLVSKTVVKVPENTKSIIRACEFANNQTKTVQEKFDQLNFMFDLAIAQGVEQGRKPSEQIIKAYNEYKKPIPLNKCEVLVN